MIYIGMTNSLKVIRKSDHGYYLTDGGENDVLLPTRFVPSSFQIGATMDVFVYQDSENRPIATTQTPLGKLDEVVYLKVVSSTPLGAFLDWGLMKDLFVPITKQKSPMNEGEFYWVKIYIEEKTGRLAASEKFDAIACNENLTIKEMETVSLGIVRKTNIGYTVTINKKHFGLLYDSDVFDVLPVGAYLEGFVKKIREDGKVDVGIGKPGYKKIGDESDKILEMLQKNKGFLPFHDKSNPEEIYEAFKMSKKTFKQAVGNLYKQNLVILTPDGIQFYEQEKP